jgi:hypothetical protein
MVFTKSKTPPSKKGIVQAGPNKGRFVPVKGPGGTKSRFAGCVKVQMSKGKSKDAATKICAFIARKKGG